MKIKNIFISVLCSLLCLAPAAKADSQLCPNKFPDLVNDFCWSCMFPISLFGVTMMANGQEDFDSGNNQPICYCSNPPKVGVPTSFWEPAIIVDVHTTPGCMPTMGGAQINLPISNQQYGAVNSNPRSGALSKSFRHATYYVSPMMYLLQAVLDDNCMDRSAFDVAWMSEIDPSWNDDELANLKMPIAFAFGSLPAVLAEGIDGVAATAGFPISSIFWAAGTYGSMYPLTGNNKAHLSSDQNGRLLATRMLAMAHDMNELANLFSKGGGKSFGPDAMCAGNPSAFPIQPIMDKRQYKIQRLFPLPQTNKIAGRCCDPIGRSTLISESMTQTPLPGWKDFGYAIFRKRDCCSGVIGM